MFVQISQFKKVQSLDTILKVLAHVSLNEAQVSFSDRPLSIVCQPVNFLNFYFIETLGQFQINLTQSIWRGIQVSLNEGLDRFQRGDNNKIVKFNNIFL